MTTKTITPHSPAHVAISGAASFVVNKVADSIRAELAAIDGRQIELLAERDEISYSAVVERDKGAVARLTALNAELGNLKNQAASLEAALREAARRDTAAAEARTAEKRCADARAADAILDDAEKLALEFDDALAVVRDRAVAFEKAMIQVRRLTRASPQHDAVRVYMFRSVRTALHQSPVHIDEIAPSERTKLMAPFQAWARSARVFIASTLNKTSAREAA